MGLKEEIEALKDEAKEQSVSELALWLYKKILQDLIPSINQLDKRTENATELQKQTAFSLNLLDDVCYNNKIDCENLIAAVITLDSKKSDKATIVSPDATDLASTMELLNEIKEKLNQ